MDLKPHVNKLMKREIYTYLTISLVVILAFLIIQALVVTLDDEVTNNEYLKFVWTWVIGALLLMWGLGPWLSYLWIVNLEYSIEDERLVIQKGILTKKSISIPYSAVTDFTLSRSLYERWIGIGTLLVQTAGQGAQTGVHEGKLEGLTDFDALYTTLRGKIKAFRGMKQEEKTETPTGNASDSEVLQSILEEVKRIGRKLE